jgi:hypothetical protein
MTDNTLFAIARQRGQDEMIRVGCIGGSVCKPNDHCRSQIERVFVKQLRIIEAEEPGEK